MDSPSWLKLSSRLQGPLRLERVVPILYVLSGVDAHAVFLERVGSQSRQTLLNHFRPAIASPPLEKPPTAMKYIVRITRVVRHRGIGGTAKHASKRHILSGSSG